jgi:type I restriction enzyme S subunit
VLSGWEVPQNWNVVKGGYIGRLFGSESVSESSVSDFGQLPFIKSLLFR